MLPDATSEGSAYDPSDTTRTTASKGALTRGPVGSAGQQQEGPGASDTPAATVPPGSETISRPADGLSPV